MDFSLPSKQALNYEGNLSPDCPFTHLFYKNKRLLLFLLLLLSLLLLLTLTGLFTGL